MANKVGPLIKEARTNAGLTQEQLAKKIDGDISASDISKAERGEKELTQAVLKQIAKICGVTQSSLINAAKESTYGSSSKKTSSSSSSKKTSSSSSSSSKKTSSSSSSSKKTSSSSSSKKTSSSSSQTSMKVSSTEKKLVELYRAADSDTKKNAMKLLKGEELESDDILSNILSSGIEMLSGKLGK